MFGKSCVRKKRVWSPRMGRMVQRCAQFSGGSRGSLGALPFDLDQIKDTALTGAIAVAGAVTAQKGVEYLAPMLKLQPDSYWTAGLEIATGIAGGYAIGHFMKKPDIGAAFAVGPIVINGMKLLGYLITPPVREPAAPVSGYQNQLGMTIPADQFPPAWAYQSPYMAQAQQQNPGAWSIA